MLVKSGSTHAWLGPNVRWFRPLLAWTVVCALVLWWVQRAQDRRWDDPFARSTITGVMRTARAYQSAHPWVQTDRDWIRATYYTGIMAMYATTGDGDVLEQALAWGRKHRWAEGPAGSPPANRMTCGQTYLQLHFS